MSEASITSAHKGVGTEAKGGQRVTLLNGDWSLERTALVLLWLIYSKNHTESIWPTV